MIEARDGSEHGGFLGLGDSAPLPDMIGAVGRLQQQLRGLESRGEEDGHARRRTAFCSRNKASFPNR